MQLLLIIEAIVKQIQILQCKCCFICLFIFVKVLYLFSYENVISDDAVSADNRFTKSAATTLEKEFQGMRIFI